MVDANTRAEIRLWKREGYRYQAPGEDHVKLLRRVDVDEEAAKKYDVDVAFQPRSGRASVIGASITSGGIGKKDDSAKLNAAR